jgi:sulfopyruvate decarboxylase TPP-binding subunit
MVHIDRKHRNLSVGAIPLWKNRHFPNTRYDQHMKSHNDLPRAQHGQGGQQLYQYPNVNYYTNQALGVPVSYLRSERLIRELEEDKIEERRLKRQELENVGVRGAFEDLRSAMRMNLIQNHVSEGGAGNPINQVASLIAAGIIVPIQTIYANGNITIRYELRNTTNNVASMGADRNGRGDLQVADIIRSIETHGKQNEIIMKYIEERRAKDAIERFERVKRSADPVDPPQTANIKTEQLKIEEHRLESDDDILARREERKESRNRLEQEKKQGEEPSGGDQGDKLMISKADMVTYKILPTFGTMYQGQALTI